jgi:hypothetical protein
MPGGRDGHLPHLAAERLRRHIDWISRRAGGPRVVGQRALADAPRDEDAEREDEQRWDGLRPETN